MEFVTYEIAKKLKEKGFREDCLAYYTTEYTLYNNVITLTDDKYLCVSDIDYEEFLVSHNSIKYTNGNYVDAPTISQVLKWLRNEKEIYCLPHFDQGIDMWFNYVARPKTCCVFVEHISGSIYNTYEDAAISGIEYILDNLI
jgi:hypothetical protein